jgi:hypothetical protein
MTYYALYNFYGKGSDSESRLKLTSYCSTCQGNYTLTYECQVMGNHLASESTIWSGSAFDCAKKNNVTILLHRLYGNNSTHTRASADCNNGSIVAQSLWVNNDIYVSQLSVTMSDSIQYSNIKLWQLPHYHQPHHCHLY